MHSVFKTYLTPNANKFTFEQVSDTAFALNEDDFINNVSAVKSFLSSTLSTDLKTKAERLYTFLMSEVAQQYLGKSTQKAVTVNSYPLVGPEAMYVLFSSEDGYLPIKGGDTINHARYSEKKLHIAHYCESEVTEYQCHDLESFKSELASFEEFFKEGF